MNEEMTGQILASLERINVRLDGMDERFDRIETRLDGIDRYLDGIDKRLDRIEAQVDRIDVRLDIVERLAAERHAELVGKINRVDAKIDRLEIKIDRLHGYMDDVRLRIAHTDTTVHHWGGSVAIQNGRDLRFDARLALVEKRLEIRDNPGA